LASVSTNPLLLLILLLFLIFPSMPQDQDFETQARAVGERLALLLVAADLTDEVKANFAAMIPEMTPAQIDRLITILEARISNTNATQEAELGKAIQAAQDAYETSRQAAERKAMAELEEIETLLNAG